MNIYPCLFFFNMNQVAQGNAHEVRCDLVIRLYINKVSIATSTRLPVKPNKSTTTNLLNYLQHDWRSRTELTVTLSRQEMSSFDNQVWVTSTVIFLPHHRR